MPRQYNMPEWLPWEQNASPMFLTMTLNAGMRELRQYFGTALWTTVILFEEGQAQWMFRPKELKLLGQKMIDFLLCPAYRVAFETGYEESEASLLAEAKRIQFEIDPMSLSDADLIAAFEDQCKRYYSWYRFGWFCEPVSFQGQDILSAWLEKHTDKLPNGMDPGTAVKALLVVDDVSFTTDILKHLRECAAELAKALADSELLSALRSLPEGEDFGARAAQIILNRREDLSAVESLMSKVEEHSAQFFWKRSNYFSTEFLTAQDVLEDLLGREGLDLDDPVSVFSGELEKISIGRQQDLEARQQILDLLPAYERGVATLASSVGGSLMEARKKTIMIANSAFDRLIGEVTRRTESKIEDCRLLIPQEFGYFLHSPESYSSRFEDRRVLFVVYQGDHPVLDEMISDIPLDEKPAPLGFEHLHMLDPYVAEGAVAEDALARLDSRLGFLAHEEAADRVTLQGVVTYSNSEQPFIEGIVRIVRDPKRQALQEGEILVAPSTTPDYAEQIRRCRAILTDWGGQTSHAAIVSRELGKPCIIGMSYASRVLMDGMKIRLDMKEGTVAIVG